MKKKYFLIGDLKRNAFILAASAALGLGTSACNSNTTDETAAAGDEWNADEPFKEGVITEMTETSPDNWKITDEYPTPSGQVAAILHHLDGKTDTLTGAPLQKKIDEYTATNPQNGSGFSMMNVLMWGGIGYMAGRMMAPRSQYYANPNTMNRTSTWRNNVDRAKQSGGGFNNFANRSAAGRTDNAAYKNSNYTGKTYRSTAPRAGRSGFFNNRGTGYSG